MKKIIALGGSNSKKSINKQLAHYAAGLIRQADVLALDLTDFPVPMYGIDLEEEEGIPEDIAKLTKLIQKADGIVISLAEHNGAYSAVFKNVFDWISRLEAKVFETTPVLLLSASPGGRGGQSVMDIALDRFPRHGATVVESLTFPNFYDNFKNNEVVNEELKSSLLEKIQVFEEAI